MAPFGWLFPSSLPSMERQPIFFIKQAPLQKEEIEKSDEEGVIAFPLFNMDILHISSDGRDRGHLFSQREH
jgi:hypothetical protein